MVTGIPATACSFQLKGIPILSASPATIMLAMLPTIRRLPANVLDSARIFPAPGISLTRGRSSITAGTLDTRFESPAEAP